MTVERGEVMTYEIIRDWARELGGIYANRILLRAWRPAKTGISTKFPLVTDRLIASAINNET